MRLTNERTELALPRSTAVMPSAHVTGFHEAIGDAVALAITPAYRQRIGLLDEASEDPKAVINRQMNVALQRVAFLPFGLVVDRWRCAICRRLPGAPLP